MIYRFTTQIVSVGERFKREHVSGSGDAAQFRDASTGWWITLDNLTSYCVGSEKPLWRPGDTLRITMEKL